MPYMKKHQYDAARNIASRKIQSAFRNYKSRKANQVATIARIEAQKVVNKNSETKSALFSASHAPTDDTVIVNNLVYSMTQGTSAETLVGEKFNLKNIHFRFNIFNNVGGSTNSDTKVYRLIVFRTKKPLTNSSTTITPTDLFRTNVPNLASRAHVDLSKVSLLYDKTFTMTPQQTGQRIFKPLHFKVDFNTQERFDADNSGYLKKSNIYLACTAVDGSIVAQPIAFNYTYTINYKDE